MANLSRAESKRLYSWWWDGHTSPKNSKWLQENLTDIDAKVKLMIKLIEEDADSFAKRAEMYYKKRPELMKLVEEFYRAYRALAERYDHATGALRQAHRTMAEVFPNQVPSVPADDSLTGSSSIVSEPGTPEIAHPLPASFELDELHKDALGPSPSQFHPVKRTGLHSNESNLTISRQGLKQLNELFGTREGEKQYVKFAKARVTEGLNFHGGNNEGSENIIRIGLRCQPNHMMEEGEHDPHIGVSSPDRKTRIMFNSERADKVEAEVQTLKEDLAKLEAEKKDGLLQYQQALERLSNLEIEVNHAQDLATGLSERASKADVEVQFLNQALIQLQAEKDAGIQQFQQCLDRISDMETKILCAQEDAGGLTERATKAESEVQNLKQALARLEAENESTCVQYNKFLETISDLQTKLSHAVEEARSFNERAVRAETEVQFLKESIAKLDREKEADSLQYLQSLERISYLESEITQVQEEARRLSNVIVMGVAKLNSTEEQYLLLERETRSLQSEVDNLSDKTAVQEQDLIEKDEELRRLQVCIQEEFSNSIEAETALRRLQDMQFRSQEEQKALKLELQHGADMMNEMKLQYQLLEDKVRRFAEENKSLNEQNLKSASLINNMQEEIFSLRDTKAKLEEDVDVHVNHKNALQQELLCLKKELNDLNKFYLCTIEQVKLVGLTPESLGPSVKDLQDENSRLKEVLQKEINDRAGLLEKLGNLENLSEKNVLLESSLSVVTVRLEALREKIKAQEQTCQLLYGEKSTHVSEKDLLIPQLTTAIENVEMLSEKNALLEDTLSNASAELEEWRAKSEDLEHLCESLDNEKCGLISERDILVSQFGYIQQRLEDLGNRYTELKEKCSYLENEKESRVHQVEEIGVSLNLKKQELSTFIESYKRQLAHFEHDRQILQEEDQRLKKEFEEEEDKSVSAQVEIFILHRCIQDMKERNVSLLLDCQKHLEAAMLSEKLVTGLKWENLEQQVKVESLLHQVERLRTGTLQMLFVLKNTPDEECEGKLEDDELLIQQVIGKIEDLESSLSGTDDEKQLLLLEKSVLLALLGQMRLDIVNLTSERNTLSMGLETRTEELLIQQNERKELFEINEKFRLDIGAMEQQQKILKVEMETQCTDLSTLQEMYPVLQNENSRLREETWSLTTKVFDLKEKHCRLEDENSDVLGEVMNLGILSLVFRTFGAGKALDLKNLNRNLDNLRGVNDELGKEVKEMRGRLEIVEEEDLCSKESIGKLGDELEVLRCTNDQLNHHILVGKELLSRKEVELAEANEKLESTENKNMELNRELDELKRGYDEATMTKEVLEEQIRNISEDNTQKNKETTYLHESNEKLESEHTKLHEELKKQKIQVDYLSFELKQQRDEVKRWETEASTLFGDCQVSGIYLALLEEKVIELIGVCESLEDESALKDGDIQQMKEKLHLLECENERMKSEVVAYWPVMVSLRSSIVSIENHISPQPNNHVADSQEFEACSVEMHENCHEELTEKQRPLLTDGIFGLLELQRRVKTIEKLFVEKRRLMLPESSDASGKLEAAIKDIQELQSKNSCILEKDFKAGGNIGTQPQQETLGDEENKPESPVDIAMKDIPLDQVSQSSSYDHGFGLQAMVGITEIDEEMRELWEHAEQDHQIEVVEQDNEHPSPELQFEKELGVDKLVVSKRFTGVYQEGNERKILKRLASDVQKLTDLQVNVQDLNKRVEQFEGKKGKTSKKAKDIEYTTLKVELKEVEEAIKQLVDTSKELKKSTLELPILPDGKSVLVLEELGRVRSLGRISKQAQQGSEMIHQLQQEVQRIRFAMLRLEGESTAKASKVADRKALLRDYLYGPEKNYSTLLRRKRPFFACVRPPTKLD